MVIRTAGISNIKAISNLFNIIYISNIINKVRIMYLIICKKFFIFIL
ncbi:MAG: hypothetical protein O210_OD1C00001G0318 [Parcubacteria bacterium RAAC4_OD1_1]|nr:MAG: hypothetical protein O210_OD1C00001G0318 [Parcubacteria bacterium RAAC4_OD1_1]